jgi:hypothetical protein
MSIQHGAATPAYAPQKTISEPISMIEQVDALTWDFHIEVNKLQEEQWHQTDTGEPEIPAMRVLLAVADPRWDWRTVEGIARSTHLGVDLIEAILTRNKDQIETTYSEALNSRLFRLKNRKKSPRQIFYNALNTILDILSLGKRPIVQP